MFLNGQDKNPTLHITPYPLTYSNHSLLDKNDRETYPLPFAFTHMGKITQISSEDDPFELPSPKIHVFSKKTLHDNEQPIKSTKNKVFFIDTASE